MIEVISAERCIDCDVCVEVCPTNVFDPGEHGHPVISRQVDCQTCFLCEAHCPVDALFVAPLAGPAPAGSPLRDEARLRETGRLGEYRAWIGWGRGRDAGSLRDRNQVFTSRLATLREQDTAPQDTGETGADGADEERA